MKNTEHMIWLQQFQDTVKECNRWYKVIDEIDNNKVYVAKIELANNWFLWTICKPLEPNSNAKWFFNLFVNKKDFIFYLSSGTSKAKKIKHAKEECLRVMHDTLELLFDATDSNLFISE